MDVEIGEMTSTVRVVDGAALLSPQMLQAMVQAVKDHIEQEQRAHSERRVTGGVSQERDQED